MGRRLGTAKLGTARLGTAGAIERQSVTGEEGPHRRFGLPRVAARGVAALVGWRRTLRADVVAGGAVAAYLVPQCMAYARLAELQPVSGLWAAFPAVLLVAGGLLESFPLAALGGLVVFAGIRLVDIAELRRIGAFRRNELALATAAFVGVVAFNLLVGIGLAVALSVLELFARVARAHDAILGKVPGLAGFHDIDDYREARTVPGLVMYRYDAPLCFANAEDFRARVIAAVEAEAEPEVDLTAIDMLEDLRSELARRGMTLAMARVKQDLLVFLRRDGLADRIGSDHLFPTLPTAVEAFERRSGR